MRTEPKPMDFERLARMRDKNLRGAGPNTDALIDELLADRDYNAQHLDRAAALLVDEQQSSRVYAAEWGSTLAKLAMAENEVARLRARVRVEADDVKRAGLTWAQVCAWLSAHGWSASPGLGLAHNDGGAFRHWTLNKAWVCVYENESASCIAACVGSLAGHYKLPSLDILDEMASLGLGERDSNNSLVPSQPSPEGDPLAILACVERRLA